MKDVLKRIIADFHLRPKKSYTPRHQEVPLTIDKIITIIGPRRAGKTCYLFQLMDQLKRKDVAPEQMLYLNFEDERLEFEGHYDQIFEAWLELYPRFALSDCWIFFDEIQELPNWEKFVRRTFDTVSRHIFLTGSNARLLSTEIASALRGRSISFEIMPLSFEEFLDFKGIDNKDVHSTANISRIKSAYETYVLWGGYPELVTVESQIKLQILQEYFQVMTYRDLVERYELKDVALLKFLLKRMISSFTKEFSVNKYYNEFKSRGLSISKTAIYKLVDHIFSVYLMTPVSKYAPSVLKREMSNRKIYLYDNGLYSGLNYALFEDRGKLMENLVFTHLRRKYEKIYFVKNGWECDFLVFPTDTAPFLVQVTDRLHHGNIKREIKGLESAAKMIDTDQRLLIFNEKDPSLTIPASITPHNICNWLLDDA